MTFDNVDHTTLMVVNEVEYKAHGKGNANKGLLSTYLEHDFQFDPELLAPFYVVGYPTYSEYKGGATDLFKPSTLRGGYKYQRAYRFSNGVCFDSFHNITFDPKKGLNGVFSTRNFPATAFAGKWTVGDLVETFIPNGRGNIKSVMVVEWKGESGKSLSATIDSQYFFNHNEELPGLHWRHVTFKTEHPTGTVYVQSEKITVVNSLDFGRPQNLLNEAATTTSTTSTTNDDKAEQDVEMELSKGSTDPISLKSGHSPMAMSPATMNQHAIAT